MKSLSCPNKHGPPSGKGFTKSTARVQINIAAVRDCTALIREDGQAILEDEQVTDLLFVAGSVGLSDGSRTLIAIDTG